MKHTKSAMIAEAPVQRVPTWSLKTVIWGSWVIYPIHTLNPRTSCVCDTLFAPKHRPISTRCPPGHSFSTLVMVCSCDLAITIFKCCVILPSRLPEIFWKMRQHRNTENSSPYSFVVCLVSSLSVHVMHGWMHKCFIDYISATWLSCVRLPPRLVGCYCYSR